MADETRSVNRRSFLSRATGLWVTATAATGLTDRVTAAVTEDPDLFLLVETRLPAQILELRGLDGSGTSAVQGSQETPSVLRIADKLSPGDRVSAR